MIPNLLALKHETWKSPKMRIKTHRMKSSFASRSSRGLTRYKIDQRFKKRIVVSIRSEVPYTKLQDQGGVNGRGGYITPAGFVEDGFRKWAFRKDAISLIWSDGRASNAEITVD